MQSADVPRIWEKRNRESRRRLSFACFRRCYQACAANSMLDMARRMEIYSFRAAHWFARSSAACRTTIRGLVNELTFREAAGPAFGQFRAQHLQGAAGPNASILTRNFCREPYWPQAQQLARIAADPIACSDKRCCSCGFASLQMRRYCIQDHVPCDQAERTGVTAVICKVELPTDFSVAGAQYRSIGSSEPLLFSVNSAVSTNAGFA